MIALLVFAASWITYAWTAAPAQGWLDSGEFIAAAAQLGIPHPPGHPLPTLLGRALMMMPFGDEAWRMSLASSLAGAFAVTMLYVAAHQAVCVVAPKLDRSARQVIAASAALGFALTSAAWVQSTRAEVYAIEAALVLAALAAALDFTAERRFPSLYTAGFAAGLALANHHFVTILFLVPAAVCVLAARPGFAAAGRTAAIGILGLTAFLYLPLRAIHDPEVNWGDADRADKVAWTISAKAFQKSLDGPRAPLTEEGLDVATALAIQISLPAVGFALIGGIALMRRRQPPRFRRIGYLLAGVVLTGAAGRALLGFDFDNPNAFGYLMPALASLFALAAAGLAAVAGALRGRPIVVAAACSLAVLFPFAQATRFAAESSLRGEYSAETYGRALLDHLPPRTLLITSYFETVFQMWALRAVENDRPDVDVLDRNMLTQPYAADAVARRYPALASLVLAPLNGNAPTPTAILDAFVAERPVALELAGNLNPPDPAIARLVPDGPIAWYFPAPPDAEARTAFEARDHARSDWLSHAVLADATGDRHGATRALAWNAFLDARLYCALGRRAAGKGAIARAAAAGAAGDNLLEALASSCLGTTSTP